MVCVQWYQDVVVNKLSSTKQATQCNAFFVPLPIGVGVYTHLLHMVGQQHLKCMYNTSRTHPPSIVSIHHPHPSIPTVPVASLPRWPALMLPPLVDLTTHPPSGPAAPLPASAQNRDQHPGNATPMLMPWSR